MPDRRLKEPMSAVLAYIIGFAFLAAIEHFLAPKLLENINVHLLKTPSISYLQYWVLGIENLVIPISVASFLNCEIKEIAMFLNSFKHRGQTNHTVGEVQENINKEHRDHWMFMKMVIIPLTASVLLLLATK